MTKHEFRQHLGALKAACERQAVWLAWGNRSFAECCDEGMVAALALGAADLRGRDLADLDRWIGLTITAAAEKHRAAAVAAREITTRTFEANDVWIRQWAAQQPAQDIAA
ncbi:MAG: hypothetical protein P4L90_25995 [Rhodopila sp.]|nr:hypothetical protein [Rhodopila sp.]